MGSIISGFTDKLGLTGGAEATASAIPQKTFTFGDSVLKNDSVTIDPKITALREEGRGLAESSLSNLQGDRNTTIGDRNTFIERRTTGLREGLQKQEQALGTRLEKTGVTGEFGNQSKEAFAASATQKIAQGEKIAADELFALEGNYDQVEGGLIGAINSLDMVDFANKMQEQGMSDELVKNLTNIQLGKAGAEAQEDASMVSDIGNVIMGIAMFG